MFGEGTKREAIAVTLPNEALRLGLGEEGEETRGVLESSGTMWLSVGWGRAPSPWERLWRGGDMACEAVCGASTRGCGRWASCWC